nr:hypothetical protein [Tanacetum cinerariifolium]
MMFLRDMTLESMTVSKDAKLASSNAQVAKVTQDLSNLQLSCDGLIVKASSLKFEKDKLVDQVFVLETTCSDLRNEVMGYKLFKEQIEALVKGGSLAVGLGLVVMKCLQSPKYLTALGGVIGRTINKGIHDGLAADIYHGKAGRVLVEVAAYDPATEANYVVAVNALRAVDFPFLAQLASHKDSSMFDLMDLLRLEGPVAETLEAEQLQPSPDQLMLPIHRLEDRVVIRETF